MSTKQKLEALAARQMAGANPDVSTENPLVMLPLRIPKSLRKRLKQAAFDAGQSLNTFMTFRLVEFLAWQSRTGRGE